MAKYKINYQSTPHGAISWKHEGKDDQYCEAGEEVVIRWQPSAGWGLQEAHYTDGGGNVTPIDIESRTFTMPAKDITLTGTFKRFVIEDWTGEGSPFSIVGTFATGDLPQLNGAADAGKMAYDKSSNRYVYWNGNYWVGMDDRLPVVPQYLKFTANENGCKVGFWQNEQEASEDFPSLTISMQYSIDGGVTWNTYTVTDEADPDDINPNLVSIDMGQMVMFRGINEQVSNYDADDTDEGCFLQCYIEGNVAATGDVTSLLNGVGGDMVLTNKCEFYFMFYGCAGLTQAPALPATTLANDCYRSMFYGCTGLTSAPALPATTLASNCYNDMFHGCTGLTQAPVLPATTLADGCYTDMFNGCTALTQAPALPATTLTAYCYTDMFHGCTGLNQAPALPATTLADGCYKSMFNGCTALTQAPALPATTLASNCYNDMFHGCTALTQAPALPATTLTAYCYNNMFYGCTHITSHHVATLNNSSNVFYNNSACDSFTIDAATPPTIASSTITGLKADCAIYVPAASVDAYKAKQYWSARSSYIQAIP